jgi:hypothetical protein
MDNDWLGERKGMRSGSEIIEGKKDSQQSLNHAGSDGSLLIACTCSIDKNVLIWYGISAAPALNLFSQHPTYASEQRL